MNYISKLAIVLPLAYIAMLLIAYYVWREVEHEKTRTDFTDEDIFPHQ